MLETAIVAFTTFFATVGPLDVAAVFAAITATSTVADQRRMARRGCVIATAILVVFALIGEVLLSTLGISLAALKMSAGILLLLIGIEMVFARPTGSTSTTPEETVEARTKADISVFPLATPLIAGPGAMGAVVLLMADAQGDWLARGVVMVMLLVVLLLTFLLMMLAKPVQKLFGISGMHAVSRVFGVLLAALAVQFMFDGIQQNFMQR